MGFIGRALDALGNARKRMAEKAARRLISENEHILSLLKSESARLGIGLTFADQKNLYSVLGMRYTADQKAIRAAFLRQIKKYHPDINASAEATRKTEEVNHAYSVLREKRSKERYDAEHSRGESAMGRAQFSASIDMMLASYYNKRKRTIDEFNSRVSSPMDPDSLNSAIDSVLSWSGIFDSAKTEVYGTMLEAIGRIEHNTYTGKKLLESGTVADGTLHDRLRESVEQLVVMKQQCDALRKGVYSAISEAKKRVAEQEAEIARSTHRV